MTVENLLAVIAVWSVVAVAAGLAMGSVMRRCAQWDDLTPVPAQAPERKKTA